MTTKIKCSVEGRHVIPCEALDSACDGRSTGKTRGVFVWPLTNVATDKPSRTLFGAVTKEHRRGLIFNFCPWCGTDLRAAQEPDATGEIEP